MGTERPELGNDNSIISEPKSSSVLIAFSTAFLVPELSPSEKYSLGTPIFKPLIVLFSLWEGFPNVILESMSYSIPCLGSKETRGINDLLNDNRGYLTTLTSSKKAARKILEILSNDEKYKNTTENAYKFSKKFDKVTILKDWIKLINN